jgi:hypothetical protein
VYTYFIAQEELRGGFLGSSQLAAQSGALAYKIQIIFLKIILPHAFLDVEKISNDIIAKVFYFILSNFPSLFGSCGLKFEKKNLFIRRKIVFLKKVPFGIKNSDFFAGLIFIF